MRPLEIISRMCDVTNNLLEIVKAQQTAIEQSKIEQSVKDDLNRMCDDAVRELDVIEYHTRRVIDTDDGEPIEKGAADDD